MEGTTSKAAFGSHRVHFEFRLAYQPEDRRPRPQQQRHLCAGPLRSANSRFFWSGGQKQRVRRDLLGQRPRRQYVPAAVDLANLRHRLYGRQVRRKRQNDRQPADDRAAQRRGGPQRRRIARQSLDNGGSLQTGTQAGTDLLAKPWLPVAISQYLGRREKIAGPAANLRAGEDFSIF